MPHLNTRVEHCRHCKSPIAECGGKTFVSHYVCSGDAESRTQHEPVEWSDTWCCACNDRCPVCDAEIEPYDYEEEGTPDEA